VKESIFSNMKLKIDVNALTDDLINSIDAILIASQGKCNVEFFVEDTAENMSVKLFSKSRKITVSTELTNELDKLGSLTYELN
jgi:hypothetical protein